MVKTFSGCVVDDVRKLGDTTATVEDEALDWERVIHAAMRILSSTSRCLVDKSGVSSPSFILLYFLAVLFIPSALPFDFLFTFYFFFVFFAFGLGTSLLSSPFDLFFFFP